jgi:hypothetical protein
MWDAMLCAPFLLGIPLALWTLRLAIRPTPSKFERSAAWAASCASIAVTLILLIYAAYARRFMFAATASVVLLFICALVIWSVRDLSSTYLPSLLAVTAAHAVNTLLTMLVIVSHSEWNFAIVFTLLVVASQIIASGLLLVRFVADGRAADG